jgi:hypothetical protein
MLIWIIVTLSKTHMEQVLADAKVEITPASKIWEPQRVYEKRLNAIITKDKGTIFSWRAM